MYQDGYISTEHQLIGITEGSSNAKELLAKYGVTTDSVRTALKSVRGSQSVTDQNPEGKYQSLEKYGRDLTTAAENGKLDPVIGRDEEIRRVIHVLSRRTKNNPVLIGEPGIGKTAIDDKRLIRFPTLIAGLFRTDSFSPGVRTRRNSNPASRATFRPNLLTYFQSGSAENI